MSKVIDDYGVKEQVSDEEWSIRVNLAACYRLIALFGWDDLIFPHISARVPGPDEHFLIRSFALSIFALESSEHAICVAATVTSLILPPLFKYKVVVE